MLKYFQLSLLLWLTTTAIGQRNIVFAEIGGFGGIYSVNYERIFKEDKGLAARIGLASYGKTNAIPTQIVYIIGERNHKLELSAGVSFLTGTIDFGNGTNGFEAIPTAGIKYRYQPQDGGFFFNIGPITLTTFHPVWGGIGLGYVFKT